MEDTLFHKPLFLKLFVSTSLLLAATGEARIGETEKQCIARYGKPAKYLEKGVLFSKGTMKIYVTFSEGKADSICLQKRDPKNPTHALPIPEEEIRSFLLANSQGYKWFYNSLLPDGDVVWITKDSELGALYSQSTLSLQVYTKNCIQR